MTNQLAIATNNLSKSFGSMKALDKLNLAVPRGSIFGFLGPNGAGKTTTIKLLLGLHRADGGTVEVLGHPLPDRLTQVLARTGYVPETNSLYTYYKVEEILDFCRDCYPSWDRQLVKKYLDLFELPKNKKVGKLSKGMKNQLALTAALGARPELLILDEPTDGLDPIKKNQFLSAIVEQVAETGQTVFFSSHQLQEVDRIADRVGFLAGGKLVLAGELDEIKAAHKRVRVSFEGDIAPEQLGLEGVCRIRKEQHFYLLTIKGNSAGIIRQLAELGSRQAELNDLTLEDIFTDYVEGVQ